MVGQGIKTVTFHFWSILHKIQFALYKAEKFFGILVRILSIRSRVHKTYSAW